MKCSTKNCAHQAAFYPILRLPPPLPHDKALAASMFSMSAVCPACKGKMKIENFMISEAKEKIAGGFAAAGKMRPDFDRAWLEWGTVGDAEWLKTQGMRPQ